jgi:hypothetical protein
MFLNSPKNFGHEKITFTFDRIAGSFAGIHSDPAGRTCPPEQSCSTAAQS